MTVEEGFLDGLDITFDRGLNVIIGARGVGKTSILEMIRFALRLPHIDQRRADIAKRHAESVLGGGRVVVTYLDGDNMRSASRSIGDPEIDPIAMSSLTPTSLGQNELEGIGLNQRSRLRLLDGQAGVNETDFSSEIGRLRQTVTRISAQLAELTSQREQLRQQDLSRMVVAKQLEEARIAESMLMREGSAEMAKLRERIHVEQQRVAIEQTQLRNVDLFREMLGSVQEQIKKVQGRLSKTISEVNDRGASRYVGPLSKITEAQQQVLNISLEVTDSLESDIISHKQQIAQINDRSRPLRQEFERLQQGAGAAAELTVRLQNQMEELDRDLQRLRKLEDHIEELRFHRAQVLNEIDNLRERIWVVRKQTAERLSKVFAPRIRVALEHYGDRANYVANLADALRNSGLQHNVTAEHLAERLSPQELINAIERRDVARLTSVGRLTSARADKLITHMLGSSKLGEVITSEVDDTAIFELLVGGEYRPTEQLSTGQRCSVVLPILLADSSRTLLLDQPEDHLDNAYLVENTVDRLRSRSKIAQTIVVTHNANIPVLGDAAKVFALESDGRRGYVKEQGALADPKVVRAITDLMEGGEDAFRRRANFYRGA
ncbi:AAA family ATPase [Saccharothrix texasensis]|uniref:AAA family ATPase n=1 Tax=Saccharothrix texasensis TaxID=103734 RepID=UPI0011CDACD8|nr:AAA family ATPase [Saccharothrix texasensis]